MKMNSLALLALVLSSAAPQEPLVELETVAELENRVARLLERVFVAEDEVRRLNARSVEVAGTYAESATVFADASATFVRSTRKANLATAIVIVGSLVPAAHEFFCSYSMSPEAYRELFSLAPGLDVDHQWPSSWGGVDNRFNYQALPSGENRSLGARLIPKLSRPETWTGAVVTLFARYCR